MHPSRRLVPLVLGTALIVFTTACGRAAGPPAAAHVAGTDVTDAQLAVTAGVFESLFGLQHAACGQQDGAGDTAEAACNRYSLGAMIQFRLVQDYASMNGITVSEDQVQKAIDGFEAQVGKDTLAALLTTNNVTHDDFTQLVRLSLLENEVATHLGKAGVGQLRTAYQQNPEQYATLTVDHILVKTKAEAENVYRQVTVDEEMADHVQVYLDAVRQRLEEYRLAGAVSVELFVEQRVPIGHITGEKDAQGTADVIIIAGDMTNYGLAEEATVLANHAAGVVVGKVGTATVSVPELRAALRRS